MAEKEKFENLNVEDVIDYFGVDEILEHISIIDIAKHCDDSVLGCIDDEDLVSAIDDKYAMLEKIDTSSILDYVEDIGYNVFDYVDEDILKYLKRICRVIKPQGYIDKEDAKNLICEYLDNWMTNSF